jgi:hypothetical protein
VSASSSTAAQAFAAGGKEKEAEEEEEELDIYDVVCVGGGPAGLSLLAALRTLSLLTPTFFPPQACLTSSFSSSSSSLSSSPLSSFTAATLPLAPPSKMLMIWYGGDATGALDATSHLKLALVESQDLERVRRWELPADQFSNRVSSLTPGSVAFLEGARPLPLPFLPFFSSSLSLSSFFVAFAFSLGSTTSLNFILPFLAPHVSLSLLLSGPQFLS